MLPLLSTVTLGRTDRGHLIAFKVFGSDGQTTPATLLCAWCQAETAQRDGLITLMSFGTVHLDRQVPPPINGQFQIVLAPHRCKPSVIQTSLLKHYPSVPSRSETHHLTFFTRFITFPANILQRTPLHTFKKVYQPQPASVASHATQTYRSSHTSR